MQANKQRFGKGDLKQVFAGAKKVVVAKGKKVLTFDPKETPFGSDEFAKAVLGPSGNLRAPTAKTGSTFLVGFHADAYGERFG